MSKRDEIPVPASVAPRKPRGIGRNIAGFGVGLLVCLGLLSVIGLYTDPEPVEEAAVISPLVTAQAPVLKSAPQSQSATDVAEVPDTPKVKPIILIDEVQEPALAPDAASTPKVKKSVFDTVPTPTPDVLPEPSQDDAPKLAEEVEPTPKPNFPVIAEAAPKPEPTLEPAEIAEDNSSEVDPSVDLAPIAQSKPVEDLKPVEKLKTDETLPAEPIKTAENLLPTPEPLVNEPVVEETPRQPSVTAPIAQNQEVKPKLRTARLPMVTDNNTDNSGSLFGKRASALPKVTSIGISAPLIPQDGLSSQTGSAVAKRLKVPQSTRPAPTDTAENPTTDSVTARVEATPELAPVKRAIDENAVTYEVGAKPVMSIILIDVGNNGAPLNSAATLDLPLTFAVPVDRKDAALAATRYTQNGHEVLALSPRSVQMSLSGGQSQEQVSNLLAEFFEILPTSVGLLDVSEATLQNDRVLSKYVMQFLSESGHGLVTYSQGLNVAKREADKIGVPTGLVYRVLDQKGEAIASIQKHLDRAAAEAQKTGHVVVIGTTREKTIQAVLKWSEGRVARSVAKARPTWATISMN